MSTNIEQAVVSLLDGVNNNVQQAVQFAVDNMLILVNQILTWGIISNVAWIISSIILIPLMVWGLIRLNSRDSTYDVDDIGAFFLSGFFVVGSAIGILGSIIALITIIQIKTTPMLYLINYFSYMIK